ncbi:MAG TPA: type II toxin-antitoxin system RelE/ParE family toxin [Candidatus Acidoferrales bacterium]|nr:type II toxin-antitoxin system RelE/ParE family toxin [Candidatus Acidoferrales bacterium]
MSQGRKQPPPSVPSPEEPRPKPSFELRYTPDAAADIQALDGSVRKQIRKVLEKKLAVDPEGYGLPLRGPLAGYWKHQFRNHRIVYRIYPQQNVVVVCAVGVRKQGDVQDIYRQLESAAKTGRLAGQLASVVRNLLGTTR